MKKENLNAQQVADLIAENQANPLEILKLLDGFYECPKQGEKRTGKLVGYAGKYKDAEGKEKQYVGEVYCNFSVAEQYPHVIANFGHHLANKIKATLANTEQQWNVDYAHDGKLIVVGPQMGGIMAGAFLARSLGARFAYVEKKITKLATDGGREESELAFIRHIVNKGDKVIIAEDVSNNFSTTGKTMQLILDLGATPICLATLLNRSMDIETAFSYTNTLNQQPISLPIIPLVRKAYAEYKQDDAYVATDIVAGNVVWKPKNEWALLTTAPAITA